MLFVGHKLHPCLFLLFYCRGAGRSAAKRCSDAKNPKHVHAGAKGGCIGGRKAEGKK